MCQDCDNLRMPENIIGKLIYRIDNVTSLNNLIGYLKITKNLGMTDNELQEYQNSKLRALVKHSYDTVPYYKELFDKNNIRPAEIKSAADLSKVPITDKKTLQKLGYNDIISKCFSKRDLTITTTSGSTGIALKIYVPKKTMSRRLATGRRPLFLHGFSIFDKTLMLSYYYYADDFISSLGLFRQKQMPRDLNVVEQFKIFKEYKADVIRGYPSRVGLLARHILHSKLEFKKPRIVITSGEILENETRAVIEKAFGKKVANFYACEEFGPIAWQCKLHNGLHINSDSLIIQIVNNGKEAKKGQAGKVVCTGLDNLAMPLIRYDLGDIAALAPRKCPCGLEFPMLKGLEGRASEYFIAPDGNKFPTNFVFIEPQLGGVMEYQIIQRSQNRLDVSIVKAKDWTPAHAQKIWDFLHKCSSINDIRIKYVKSIGKTGRVKLKRFIPMKQQPES